MRFLVTGGAGFIGSHLCQRLIRDDHTVVCYDNFNNYYDPEIKRLNVRDLTGDPDFRLVEGDILDFDGLQGVFEESRPEVVVHLAARAGVRPSIEQPRLYQKVNVEGSVNCLELGARYQVSRFILASSSSVYGNNKKVPFSEKDPVDFPVSPYAATKKACELVAYTYHSLYKLPVTCLRFFTVYGPRQRPDMAIHKFTRALMRDEEITMFGDGSSRRDYTYIDDIISGVERAVRNCSGYHIYNLGESRTTELRELIRLLENATGHRARIRRMPNQPGDVAVTYADVTRAREELGYQPTTPIEEGILRFVEWYRGCREGEV
jgi:UDP-glucuronate 4-epimerase